MLDYKNIIIKHYALSLSGSEIARQEKPVRDGYVMLPEASSIDTLLSRSKALADQMRDEADD